MYSFIVKQRSTEQLQILRDSILIKFYCISLIDQPFSVGLLCFSWFAVLISIENATFFPFYHVKIFKLDRTNKSNRMFYLNTVALVKMKPLQFNQCHKKFNILQHFLIDRRFKHILWIFSDIFSIIAIKI